MLVVGVTKATFYHYQRYAKDKCEAREHGNMGLLKPRPHTEHVVVTLKCLIRKEADHMPHKTWTLKSGEKVVSMILPVIFSGRNK